MEEILAQQKITNSRLLRIENKSLELKNILANIMESSLSIKNVMGAMNSGLESLVNQNNTVIAEIKNLSDETTNSFTDALRKDKNENSEEEREAIAREEKVIDLLVDIKNLLSVKPDDSLAKLVEKLSEKDSEEDDGLFPDAFPIPMPGLPGKGKGKGGPRAPRVPVPPPVSPGAPLPPEVPVPPGAPLPPGTPAPTEPVPPGTPAPDTPEPPPKKPSKLGKLARGAGRFARGALRFVGPVAIGAGLLEGYKEYKKTGEMDKAMFGFAGGATEFLTGGLVGSEDVKSSLEEAQLATSDIMSDIGEMKDQAVTSVKGAVDGVMTDIGEAKDTAILKVSDAMTAVSGAVDEAQLKVSDAMTSAEESITSVKEKAQIKLTNAMENVSTSIKSTLTGISSGMASLEGSLAKSIESFADMDLSEKLRFMMTGFTDEDAKITASGPILDVSPTNNLMPPQYGSTAAAFSALGSSSVSRLPAGRLLEQSAATTTNVNVANTTINNNNNIGGNTTLAVSGAGQPGNSSKPSFNKNSSR